MQREADLDALKAAFLAKGRAVTACDPGVAYGVDREADRAKRVEAREALRFERIEHEAEHRFQAGVEATYVRRFLGRA